MNFANMRASGLGKSALAVGLACVGGAVFLLTKPPAAFPTAAAKLRISGSVRGDAPVPYRETATELRIRFYAERVARDPEDCRSQNALAELYLQRVRETGLEDDLPLALAAARASLAAVGAARNVGGLSALAHAGFSNHDFLAARDHARQLGEFEPDKSEPLGLLGDAECELGNYPAAEAAFERMQQLGANEPGTATRLARFAFLHGDLDAARQHLESALARLLELSDPPAEAVAWCQWQLGEMAIAAGDLDRAEARCREALATIPDYFHALASLGAVRAAQGALPEAIGFYEQAIRVTFAPAYVAALGDLYALDGRTAEAASRYQLVEQLAEHVRRIHGQQFNRQLALFLADHDLQPERAYALASAEFEVRRDIFGADALAWTAFKSGRIPEAQAAMQQALRLGTRDAKLLHHAAMIGRAAGHHAAREASSLEGRGAEWEVPSVSSEGAAAIPSPRNTRLRASGE